MYPKKLEDLNKDSYGQPLVCSGCAHSSAGAEFPGMPSGERPCCFCTRNVQRVQWVERMPQGQRDAYGKTFTAFYDNSPMKKCPMDCYHSIDRLTNNVPDGVTIIT